MIGMMIETSLLSTSNSLLEEAAMQEEEGEEASLWLAQEASSMENSSAFSLEEHLFQKNWSLEMATASSGGQLELLTSNWSTSNLSTASRNQHHKNMYTRTVLSVHYASIMNENGINLFEKMLMTFQGKVF